MSLLGELKRRNVFRVAMVYAVAGWALLQVGDLLFGAFDVPPWGLKLLLGLLLLGFPLALVFARTGKADLARAELASMRKAFGDAAAYQYAQVNATLGDRDEAFHWLAMARRVRDPGLMGWVFPDPTMDSVRSDPRYDKLVRELGFVGKP